MHAQLQASLRLHRAPVYVRQQPAGSPRLQGGAAQSGVLLLLVHER